MEENVLAYEQQPVDNSAKEKKKNKTKKVIATTTYFIAMLCLLAGLFAPLFQFNKDNLPESMMFRYLPSMFNGIFGREIIPLGNYFLPFMPEYAGKFNFTALIGLLYAVVAVISVLMLIPILLGSKKKNTSARSALGVEVLAMLVTLTYIAAVVYNIAINGTIAWSDYNFLLAFGGSLLMAIIQTVSSKGSIGVSKVIALLLSVIGVIALLDITLFIPKLAEVFTKLPESIGGGSAFFLKLSLPMDGGSMSAAMLGLMGIQMIIDFKGTFNNFKELATSGKEGIVILVIFILLILIAIFTVINLVSDVIGLSTGKKFKKDRSPCKNGASNTFALVRYILALIFIAAIIVMSFVIKELEMTIGLYMWLLTAVLFISLINAAVRTAVDNARYKKGTVAPSEDSQQRLVLADPAFTSREETPAPAPDALPVYEQPVYEEPVQESLPVYQPETIVAEPEYVEPDYMPRLPVAETTERLNPNPSPLLKLLPLSNRFRLLWKSLRNPLPPFISTAELRTNLWTLLPTMKRSSSSNCSSKRARARSTAFPTTRLTATTPTSSLRCSYTSTDTAISFPTRL
ncbi:MAG: hypothetical protein K2K04_01530 [Clostridia bacterium]|nr:hypothetical protein [Clostridia bacterium]